jgi:hypothetical protein
MTKLPIFLTLLTVACGGGDFTSDPVTGLDAGGSAGSAGTGSAQAGTGGSSSAGRGGTAQGGSSSVGGTAGAGGAVAMAGSGGAVEAGAGGQAAVCENPSIVMPMTFVFGTEGTPWHYESDGKCATVSSMPVTCTISWHETGWIDASTYETLITAVNCESGSAQVANNGTCGAETACAPEFYTLDINQHVRFVVANGKLESVLTMKNATWEDTSQYWPSVFGFNENGCAGPSYWGNMLLSDMAFALWTFLQEQPVVCGA